MANGYCGECGAPLSQGSTFCEECGARVKSSPIAQQPVQQNAAIPQPVQQPVQQPMQQPMQQIPQQMVQPASQAQQAPQTSRPFQRQRPAQKKSNSKLVIGIIGAVVVVAVVITILVLTGVMGGGDPSLSNKTGPTTVNQTGASPASNTAASTNQTNAASPGANTVSPTTDPAPSNTPAGADVPTSSEPTASDFTWFTDNASSWMFGALPSGAELTATSSKLEGSWKGLQLIIDYDGTLLGKGYFTATFDTSNTDAAVSMTIDWYYLEWSDGTREDISTRADETKTGTFELPTFAVGTLGDQIQMYSYELNDRQYVEGLWIVQSGEEVRVALTRP